MEYTGPAVEIKQECIEAEEKGNSGEVPSDAEPKDYQELLNEYTKEYSSAVHGSQVIRDDKDCLEYDVKPSISNVGIQAGNAVDSDSKICGLKIKIKSQQTKIGINGDSETLRERRGNQNKSRRVANFTPLQRHQYKARRAFVNKRRRVANLSKEQRMKEWERGQLLKNKRTSKYKCLAPEQWKMEHEKRRQQFLNYLNQGSQGNNRKYSVNKTEGKRKKDYRKPVKCGLCGKVLKSAKVLQNHMQVLHSDERRYSCSLCGRTFAYEAQLKRHKSIAHGPKNHM